jgi:hypothetical protein
MRFATAQWCRVWALLGLGLLSSACPGSGGGFWKDLRPTTDGRAADGTFLLGEGMFRTEMGEICATKTFEVKETQEVFAVPSYVSYMHIKAWGAGGNQEAQCPGQEDAGMGGYTEGVFKAAKGSQIIIIVGKRGRAGISDPADRMRFGFGDWGGGGLTGVFRGGVTITENDRDKALLIAGGGGSASGASCILGGSGNHPSSGGQPTMQGGKGADGMNGGAGGYEGGTGGVKGGNSKGGKGFVAKEALSVRTLWSVPGSGKAPKSDDKDYDGVAGTAEASGRIVIHFSCGQPQID